jgi:hypothetical protein
VGNVASIPLFSAFPRIVIFITLRGGQNG